MTNSPRWTAFLYAFCPLLVFGCEPAASPPAGSNEEALATADSLVAAWVEAETVPGAVLLVAQGGDVVFEEAYGYAQLSSLTQGGPARLGDPIEMTTSTVFDLASVTKVMATAFSIMLLVDDGLVDLDAPVSTYLPDFVDEGKNGITVRHLLTHTAGLTQWLPLYYHANNSDEAYAYIRDLPLSWAVGEGRHYSDLGFQLLGLIVEAVSGESLAEFPRKRLYEPLGLRHTGYLPSGDGPFAATSHGNPFERRMVYDSTFGYEIDGDASAWDEWRTQTLAGEVNDGNAHHAFKGVAGHAGLFSTAQELAVLVELLLQEGQIPGEGNQLLSPGVVAEFLKEGPDDQALGWQVRSDIGVSSFSHTGFTGTFVLGVPSQDLAVVLLTNRQNLATDGAQGYPNLGDLQAKLVETLVPLR